MKCMEKRELFFHCPSIQLILLFCLFGGMQPEPEFRPPMSEVVQALVRLVQRANMSKRTVGTDQGASPRTNNPDDTQDYM